MKSLFMYLGTGRRIDSSWFDCLQKNAEEAGEEREQMLDEADRQVDVQNFVEESNLLVGKQGGEKEGKKSGGEEIDGTGKEHSEGQTEMHKIALKEKLRKSIESFTKNLESRIDNNLDGYEASVNTFVKQLSKLEKVKSDSALQKTLCTFGKSLTEPLSKGKKKKLGLIPMQITALSRRKFKLRGSRSAIMGAPTKNSQ